jgi:hypothetical protein
MRKAVNLTLQITGVSIRTTSFNITELCILHTDCIYMLGIFLRKAVIIFPNSLFV